MPRRSIVCEITHTVWRRKAGTMKKEPRISNRSITQELLVMMLPCMLVMLVIFIYPLSKLLINSLQRYKLIDPVKTFIGLDNYINAFEDKNFVKSLGTTLKYVAMSLAIEVPLALVLMEIIASVKKGQNFIRTCFLPPMVVPSVVNGTIWKLMFNPSSGIITYIALKLGFENAANWLTMETPALWCLVAIDVWASTPFLLVILLAGRASISETYYEASKIDGAGPVSMFFKITLPLLKNQLLFGLMIRLTDCIRVFPTIHIMTAGGPGTATQTINYLAYKTAFSYSNIGYASAMGVIMMVVSIICVLLLSSSFKMGGRKR